MRFAVLPSLSAEVTPGFEEFQKLPVQDEHAWYDVISYRARMTLKNINEQGIIDVEKSGGWGYDIRGKAKGVPLLRITKAWLRRIDHQMKSTQRSFSAPPRMKWSEKKELGVRSRFTSEGDPTVENHSRSPIYGIAQTEDLDTLWDEFTEAENQVIENRMLFCKLW